MSYFTTKHRPHGAKEWMVERVALLVLIPLALWLVFSGVSLAGQGPEAVLAWASSIVTRILLAITAVLFALFGLLAWKVIIEDYVHGSARRLAEFANAVFFTALGTAAVIFIFQIASGAAPTGA